MNIKLRTNFGKGLLILLELLGVSVLVAGVTRPLWAGRWAAQATIPGLEHAVKLDPGNATFRLDLGRLYRYDLPNLDPGKAMEHIKRALEVNPYSPQPWIEMAAGLEGEGRIAEAEACLRRADQLAPNLPNFQWVIGNFFLLHGNLDDAFRAYKIVLRGTTEYDGTLFDTAWKASGDGPRILEELIPRSIFTEFEYLGFLTLHKRHAEAYEVWKRIASGSKTFPATTAAPYLDALIETHQPDRAYQVWTDLRAQGLIRPTEKATKLNLIINGDFEEEILNMGFDWRLTPVEGAYVGWDRTNFHSASHALAIQFTGKQNVDFRGVRQYVILEPGSAYQLRGYIKTEGITTNNGPRFEIHDAYDGTLLGVSENFTGGTDGWTQVIINFRSSPRTHLAVVGLARPPSEKFDNLIAGKTWIDDISLAPQAPEETHR